MKGCEYEYFACVVIVDFMKTPGGCSCLYQVYSVAKPDLVCFIA